MIGYSIHCGADLHTRLRHMVYIRISGCVTLELRQSLQQQRYCSYCSYVPTHAMGATAPFSARLPGPSRSHHLINTNTIIDGTINVSSSSTTASTTNTVINTLSRGKFDKMGTQHPAPRCRQSVTSLRTVLLHQDATQWFTKHGTFASFFDHDAAP